jgi:hypothetical protein
MGVFSTMPYTVQLLLNTNCRSKQRHAMQQQQQMAKQR